MKESQPSNNEVPISKAEFIAFVRQAIATHEARRQELSDVLEYLENPTPGFSFRFYKLPDGQVTFKEVPYGYLGGKN